LQLLAWAEDSMPYECIGETRRLALMLLEDTMGRALKALDMSNLEMERDKTAAAAKAAPVQADAIPVGHMEAAGLGIDLLNARDTARGAAKVLESGQGDEDTYQTVSGMVELLADKLADMCERYDRARIAKAA